MNINAKTVIIAIATVTTVTTVITTAAFLWVMMKVAQGIETMNMDEVKDLGIV